MGQPFGRTGSISANRDTLGPKRVRRHPGRAREFGSGLGAPAAWLGAAVRCLTLVVYAAGAITAVFLLSLTHFLWIVDAGERHPDGRAEAIVVLSGDPFRVSQAVTLLAAGHGQRLFLAGVDNGDEISRQQALHPGLFACCVEVEHETMTTHEDAAAIATWARSRQVRSLLVVTSISHLPRALVEIHDALPGVATVPSGVTRGLTDFSGWRTDPELWRALMREYVKTVGTLVVNRLPFLRDLLSEPDGAAPGKNG